MLNQFFIEHLPKQGIFTIDGDEGRHAATVLRLQVGERIRVGDGLGAIAEAQIISVAKNSLTCEIVQYQVISQPRIRFTVIQALPKSDRMKETIELLTEGGVTTIVPWQAERSIAQWQSDGLAKWQNAAREASKQSRRSVIPEIVQCISIRDFATLFADADLALIFHESETRALSEILAQVSADSISHVILIIGPEGGITDSESATAIELGAKSVRMGEPIFRTAHAGVAALAALQTGLRLW